jgi:hypothetical protein
MLVVLENVVERRMHVYQVHLRGQESAAQFTGTFSATDLSYLTAPRLGRAFDLEYYKAYVMPNGQIALTKKPDYGDCATVNLARLVTALRIAVSERRS